jgi:hypothetical protein
MPERDGERWNGVKARAVEHRQIGAGEVMTETAVGTEIPYFIRVRGCNNCRVFKSYTTLTGTEYGGNHTLHAKCVHMGCDRYGYNVLSPFITPQEFLRIGINTGLRCQAVERARKVVARFREFYDTRGGLRPWVVTEISQQDPFEG